MLTIAVACFSLGKSQNSHCQGRIELFVKTMWIKVFALFQILNKVITYLFAISTLGEAKTQHPATIIEMTTSSTRNTSSF